MPIKDFLLMTAFITGMTALGGCLCWWLIKKAGIEPPGGLYWKIYKERFTGQVDSPSWSGSRHSRRSGSSQELWSRSAAWYIVPRKCAALSVEAVVFQGRAALEIYGDGSLLRRWESWENPKFTVDLQGVRRLNFYFYAEDFTGSICCAGRRQLPVA